MWSIIRGQDYGEVNPRTQIKSMLSAKSFPQPINSKDQADRWLRIFCADIYSRLLEEGVTENRRRPKTMNLHHRQGGQTWSRQMPIPQGRPITETGLFEIAKTLLQQIILEGRVWPCANLSLSVGGFEEGPVNNHSIGSFLVKGEEAQTLNNSRIQAANSQAGSDTHAAKRRKTDTHDLGRFFKQTSKDGTPEGRGRLDDEARTSDTELGLFMPEESTNEQSDEHVEMAVEDTETWNCPKCNGKMHPTKQVEHMDWHFAKELQASESIRPQPQSTSTTKSTAQSKEHKPKLKGDGKGQMKLFFK